MQAVILAGGQGSRLYPLTAAAPKPLLPIMGRPLLGYLVDHLAAQGVDHVVVTSGYLGGAIQSFVSSSALPVAVTVVQEMSVRGTAGAVADLAPALRSPFLVVSGDAVLSLDLPELVRAHADAGGPATVCVAPAAERFRFGLVDLRAGRVERFLEKPGIEELVPAAAVNSGAYLLNAEAFAGLPAHGPLDFARDVFPQLLTRGAPLGAARALRAWLDVGTPEAYRQAHFDAMEGRWPWSRVAAHPPRLTGPGAVLLGTVACGPDVVIGAGAHVLGPVYLGAGVEIGPGAEVSRSVVLEGAVVGGSAVVRDAVVGPGAVVPAGNAVGSGIYAAVRPAPARQAVAEQPQVSAHPAHVVA